MPGKLECLKYKHFINTTASEAYRAFTNPAALGGWLCNQAYVQKGPSSSFFVWWQNGYFATGEFTKLSPDKNVSITWLGKDEPGKTNVSVTIKPKDEGIQITLIHSGFGTGNKWKATRKQIDRGWKEAFENLKTALENGQDQRLLRRPMMGISGLVKVNEESAKQHNFPKTEGVLLLSVLDDMGAQNAGLQAGDILVKIDGKKFSEEQDLFDIIGKHKADDTVKVTYYRNGEKQNCELMFSKRLQFDIPPKPTDLAAKIEEIYKPLMAQLENILKGITDEKASINPTPDEWNIKQVLAHLIVCEKDTHTWLSAIMDDNSNNFDFHANKTDRLNALITVFPSVNMLIKDLKRHITETVALISNIPESIAAHKYSYNQIGEFLHTEPYHYQDHIEQIKKIINNINHE